MSNIMPISNIINMDFASLYGNVQKRYNITTPEMRRIKRMTHIENIYKLCIVFVVK